MATARRGRRGAAPAGAGTGWQRGWRPQGGSRAAARALVAGLEIIEPGLVWLPEWRPDPGEPVPDNAAESYYCVLVARKP
jgi:hypothetical protein